MLQFNEMIELGKLYKIQSRLETEYKLALVSYSNSCFYSSTQQYYYKMVFFLGEILGYENQKILEDITNYTVTDKQDDKEKHKC